jgi:transcriptional regulator with XRE-family HTH domain
MTNSRNFRLRVGKIIRAHRGNISLREVEQMCGLDHSTLHDYEHGRGDVTVLALHRLASILGQGLLRDITEYIAK